MFWDLDYLSHSTCWTPLRAQQAGSQRYDHYYISFFFDPLKRVFTTDEPPGSSKNLQSYPLGTFRSVADKHIGFDLDVVTRRLKQFQLKTGKNRRYDRIQLSIREIDADATSGAP